MASSSAMASRSTTALTGKFTIDDPLSPYFLYYLDNPGIALVSQPLTSENYASWSRAMLIVLSTKNKVGFVHGSLVKLDASDVNLLNSWICNNNVVILLLTFGMILRIVFNKVIGQESLNCEDLGLI